MFQGKKQKRFISIILTASLLAATAVTVTGVGALTAKNISDAATAKHQASEADRKMAQDISDVTGVSTATLLNMKTNQNSWNDVLQKVQDGGVETAQDMTEEELSALTAEQPEEDVEEVSALAERVVFNLQEIVAKQSMQNIQETVEVQVPGAEDSETEYDFETLAAQFQKNRSIYLTLLLKDEFGSFEQTMDEYLYSLQVEVDFSLCLADRESYDEEIAQASAQLMRSDAITVSLIEQTMLELLNAKEETAENASDSDHVSTPDVPDVAVPDMDAGLSENITPSTPEIETNPDIPSVRPDIYNELERIQEAAMPY